MSSLHIHPATTSTAERIMVAIGMKREALVRVERVDGGYQCTPLRWNDERGGWHERFPGALYERAIRSANRRMR